MHSCMIPSASKCKTYSVVNFGYLIHVCACLYCLSICNTYITCALVALSQSKPITPLRLHNNINRYCFAYDEWPTFVQLTRKHA